MILEDWGDNYVHSTAIIDESVKMGYGNYIGPYTIIGPNVTFGDSNRIEGHASIGQPAEHKEFFTKEGKVEIGSNNVIREFVTINAPTTGVTKMGNNCVMLRGSHLSHDSVLENKVTVSCNALIGGESYIFEGANLGLGCILHQYQVVGAYAMLGMGSVFPKRIDICPGGIFVGNPARLIKENTVGIERSGIDALKLRILTDAYWERRRK